MTASLLDTPGSAATALDEDLATAWVPDPLRGADLPQWLSEPDQVTSGPLLIGDVVVPRPMRSPMRVPVLSVEALVSLHRAVEPLRDPGQQVLAPTVCGYRRGAEAGSSYATEFMRYREMCKGLAEGTAFEVAADVHTFFQSVSLESIVSLAEELVGIEAASNLRRWASRAAASGLSCLPAGYADARFLGNIVLSSVDKDLRVPFARWVDDYRLYVQTAAEADAVIEQLRRALHRVGLTLSEPKLSVRPTRSWRPDPLASVYHPDLESPETVRIAVRRVWLHGVEDPIAHRRSLRFALPRLAEQDDDIAVEFALAGLSSIPWEAPRLVAYLARFREQPHVTAESARILRAAISDGDVWLSARLLPLISALPRGDAKEDAIERLASAPQDLRKSAAWPLAVRVLALAGHPAASGEATALGELNARAALAAFADLGVKAPRWARHAALATSHFLESVKTAPPPSSASLL